MSEENSELEERIIAELENVTDPELGIDIVNLGLVYGADVDSDLNAKITMTLTAMGCPLAETIVSDIKSALSDLQEFGEINEVDVNIVWNPPWDKSKMSRYAKIALGVAD
ncbi:metal-sulfur cluster biosynthetic enzyme [Salibacterium salarium]|uniref:Metal-sulfur cluster assembly factor n=1 Tax=Salibacterium salarium TaxID=284579 RepID=A0A428MXJ4_9BACI|nr:metal-sulfur cluster assembly factor [Salibacterium salarium]MDQ0298892.1 metal-sulfur cluster biosynthetic enzyme [Salibacterium salarium]RSL30842.1 metal-sulfur cluster assembly factor [Salibacterium salarium]